MTRAARLLDLLQALRRHHRAPVPAATLAGELGVSVRTVYRDIATLVGQGAPINGEAGVGYLLEPGFGLPPLAFTPDELDALVLGLRLAAGRGDAHLARAAADALGKIEAVIPPAFRDVAARSPLLAPAGVPASAPQLAAIRDAIRQQRKLRLAYLDGQGRESERVVWPVAVGFFDGCEVLAAWCELRVAFRHFRLDRIGFAVRLEDRPPRRHAVLLADWRAAQGLGRQF